MIFVNEKIIKQDRYPDNTLLIKYDENLYKNIDDKKEKIIDIKWNYEDDKEIFSLICIVKHIKKINKNAKLILHIPYLPHARMDRVKSNEDVFTLKYFCEIINNLKFEKVQVLDVHSNVSEALIDNIECLEPKKYIDKILEKVKIDCVFYPDEGATKRYSSMLNLPYCFGIKRRRWEDGKIEGLDIQNNGLDLKNKNILIVDDICSRGGTFYFSAKELKKIGSNNIYLWISHCEDTILQGELIKSNLIKRIYTTNSIFTKKHELIEVLEF